MSKAIQAVRGMYDILPEQVSYWQHIETAFQKIANIYGYAEIRFPLVESTALFKRAIGEVTDVVEKEMYTFDDRNGESLTLRPEGTAGCVRAGIEHGFLYNQTQRLWYQGPMFRYERPQKGRCRQFHQIGVEAFGFMGPDIDVEHLFMMARFWRQLGIADNIQLEINSLGSNTARQHYRKSLIDYLQQHYAELDKDSQRRLQINPLRILDSKNPAVAELIKHAPSLLDYLDEESALHFQQIKTLLDKAGLKYRVNPRLVRGLDYYSQTVYEWVTDKLGAQGTVCAGGRYDSLVEQLGGKGTYAVGFAFGLERLVSLLEIQHQENEIKPTPDVYLILAGEKAAAAGLLLAEKWRDQLDYLKIITHCGGGSLKNQFKKADKSGAKLGIVMGDDELISQTVTIKYLREDKPQVTLAQQDAVQVMAAAIKGA